MRFCAQRRQNLRRFGLAADRSTRSLPFQGRQVPQQVTGCLLKKPKKDGALHHAVVNAVHEEGIQRKSHVVDSRLNTWDISLELLRAHSAPLAGMAQWTNGFWTPAPSRAVTI